MKASGKGVRSAVAVLMGGTLFVCYAVGLAESRYPVLKGFELGNACEPIAVLVEPVGRAETQIGLTHQRIITTVRSRLRAARLYRKRIGPYLYVNIQVVGRAVAVRVAFNKPLTDPISREKYPAVTWHRSLLGQDNKASDVLAGLSRLTDRFIDEYLWVNEEACQRRE